MRLSRRRFLVRGIWSMCLLLLSFCGQSVTQAEGQLRAVVDREKCNGCETCVDICPEVFAIEDERAVVKLDPLPARLKDCAVEAAGECMAGAITIVEG